MQEATRTTIATGKAVLLELHKRNEEESQDDTYYIPTLKVIILGAASTASDAIGRQQVKQELFNYARDLYLQFWVKNEGENGEEVTDQTYEEGLFWFDYIYEHEQYPE